MTLAARTYPLTLADALQYLRDALGANYGAETDDATLTRELGVDAVAVPTGTGGAAVVHARPWWTAKRLIKFNTEYELDYKLKAQVNRKLRELEQMQAAADAVAGITDFLPRTGADGLPDGWPASANMPTEAVW